MISLRARLTLGVGAIYALVLLTLWFVIGKAAYSLAEDYVAARLQHDAEALLGAVNMSPDGFHLRTASISPAYLRPYSGHYYIVEGGGVDLRSRSLWDIDLNLPPASAISLRYRIEGPLGQSLLIFVRTYRFQGQPVTIAVAEDMTPLERRIAGFQFILLYVFAGALGAALLLQAWSVTRGLAPLERLRGEVARLKQGQVAELAANAPREVAPLVEEINHLLTLMAQRFERSRNAVGDLAHALKGPLSRMVRTAEDPHSGLAPEVRAQLLAEAANLRSLVERELKRARLAGHARPGQQFNPREELPHLIKAIRGIYGDKVLAIETHLPERRFAVDRDDLLELLGNLLDNAAKWAHSRVTATILDEPGLHLIVEDDGPGCAEEDLSKLATRGVRLDESYSGTGLGLSIVRAIVNEYGGTLTLGRSPKLGGFFVEIQLPSGSL